MLYDSLHRGNSISRARGYVVASMLTFGYLGPTTHNVMLSDRKYCSVIVSKYDGDLSTAYNYTCLLVAFRDAVAGR